MSDILKWVTDLYGLPASVLVGLSSIVFGYMLRAAKWFKNDNIPLACSAWCMFFTVMLGDYTRGGEAVWRQAGKQMLVGMIVGFGAWMAHGLVLKRIEEKFPALKDMLGEGAGDPPKPVLQPVLPATTTTTTTETKT
jgi:uncharacterized membrane protein YsdA (DUF1294 family)